MRAVHRVVAVFAVFFAIYLATTGLLTQITDLSALLRNAPATDPTMQAIRVGRDGPPNFQVIRDPDYAAPALPADFDYVEAAGTVVSAAHSLLGDAPLNFVELRVADGRPVGLVASGAETHQFDAATGAEAGTPGKVSLPPLEQPSLRNALKNIHRMGALFGGLTYALSAIGGLLLLTMIVTGAVVYVRLLTGRAKTGRKAAFWVAGGWWRTLHRSIALVMAIFITIVALSGTLLAVNAMGIRLYIATHDGARPGLTADVSKPLGDDELRTMLNTTLTSYRAAVPNAPIRVLRLRYFAGMPQGVVITGEKVARQLVYNADAGRTAAQFEPGYPETGMPFGWELGQAIKRIHRGDFFGLSGRLMSLLSGFSLLYLAISGAVLYLDLRSKRVQKGRREIFF
jgi:uncharacterized iron-regulated membrane protein